MKKLFSLLALPLLLAGLVPQMALAYTGPNLANAEPDAVYTYNDGAVMNKYTDETTDAQDADSGDVNIMTDINDANYFGFSEQFDGVALSISTSVGGFDTRDLGLGPDGRFDLEYWNGSTWKDLDLTEDYVLSYDIENDSTEGVFYYTWLRPTDWTSTIVSTSSSMYFVRMFIDEEYSSGTTATASQVGIIDYNLKVYVRDELGNAIEGMDEVDFELVGNYGSDDTIYSFEDLGGGLYGFAVDAPTSTDPEYDFSIFPSGFVAKDPFRSGLDLNFEEYLLESEDHAFSHRLTAENEAGDMVSIEEATAGVTPVDCEIDGGEAYCAVDIGNDGTGAEAVIYADGYLALEESITNRTASSLTQSQESYTLEYGYIAIVKDDNDNLVATATVLAGEDLDVTCDYLGSGQYGCPVSLDDSEALVRITATGFETLDSVFSSERTAHTSSQVITTFRIEEGTSTDGGGTDSDGTDSDADGLDDADEADYGTDPSDSDTDGDGISDGAEVATDTDPLDSEDFLADAEDYDADCSDPFTDTAGNFAEIAICLLYDEGIVQGRSSTTFAPSASITRAEFLKIMLLNAGHTVTADSSVEYADVESDDWYYSYITYATAEGFVEGYEDGGFHPDAYINRAEAMVMLMRIAEVEETDVDSSDIDFDDVDDSDWFAWAVVEAEENGISEGYSDDTFRPANNITRAEVAVIARRAWYVYFE